VLGIWQKERRRVTARLMGEQVDAAYGEGFKRAEVLKLGYLMI